MGFGVACARSLTLCLKPKGSLRSMPTRPYHYHIPVNRMSILERTGLELERTTSE
jgi:hypothetical protein